MDGAPHASALRRGRVSEAGRCYLVTTVTHDRRLVFDNLPAARFLIDTLRWEQRRGNADTLAFVVMPDHLHWLFVLGERRSLSRLMRDVKSVSAHRLGGPIWQPGYHDHAIRDGEDLTEVARYVVMNPLRAGLVKRIGDYPHWDAVWLP